MMFKVTEHDVCKRIDVFLLSNLEGYSRNSIQILINSQNVFVNDRQVKKNYRLSLSEKVEVILPEATHVDILPKNIPIDIVYEDDDIIVVNKAKGMVVHPAPGHYQDTLVNALMYHCKGSLSGINGQSRPGIVHRIDMDTSGLIVVCKNDRAHNGLAQQVKDHSMTRTYQAVVCGNIKNDGGVVNAPIGRHKIDRKRMAVTDKNSKQAITHYELILNYSGFAHIRFYLETGRTHQIRVHMAHISHPIVGDKVYGISDVNKKFTCLSGQCLHASSLKLVHPITRKIMEFECQMPQYFKEVLKKISG